MKKDECFYFGFVVKPVGYDGTFAVKTETDDLNKYNNLKSIFIDLNGTLTPFFLSTVQVRDKEIIWLKVDGFSHADDIQSLIRKEVYLPLTLLPELKGKQFYYHEIVGFEVIDAQHGNIGKIKDIIELPHQTILQIMQNYTEILVPLTNEILTQVDRASKTLHINAPEGLIELYTNKNNTHEDE